MAAIRERQIMRRFNGLVLGLLVLIMAGCGKHSSFTVASGKSSAPGNPAAEKAAVQSAEGWLDLVDAGSYSNSWEEAAAYFKSAVSEADWEKSINGLRPPLGRTLSRVVQSKQYATSLPGSPDGEYVVIQYDTAFEHKAHAVETITPMLDKDGQWRVAGYYIK